MKHFFITLFVLLGFFSSVFSQGNNTCANAQPFCTGTPVSYPAGTNAGAAQPGPSYGCLGSQPNPAWFSLQVASPGPIVIVMQAQNDIDFIAWGPFPNLSGNCGNLTAANQVPNQGPWNNPTSNGCSFSGSATETLIIPNAQPGQNYILLITNFSNQNQQINFNQSNTANPNAGATNCGILCQFTASATQTICSTQTATFGVTTSTSIVSVTWVGPNGFSLPSGNGSYPNIPVTASGNYTAIATNTGTNPATNTCSATRSITVRPTPTPAITPTIVCAGQNAILALTGNSATSTYTWTGPNNYASNVQNAAINNAQLVNNGIYTASITTNGCRGSASASLGVKPNPTVTTSSGGNFCFGQSFNLSANGATTYNWSGPNAFASISQNPVFFNNVMNFAGTYSVIGTANGCTASATAPVTIHPLPNIVGISSGTVCQNSPLTLSATGGTAYVWNGPNGFYSTTGINNIASAQFSLEGTYTVTGTSSLGCVNSNTLSQPIYTLPIMSAQGSRACLNDPLYLLSNGASTYAWQGPAGYTSNQQNPTLFSSSFLADGTYTVFGTSSQGCVSTATALCKLYPNPIISYSGITSVCKGDMFKFKASGGVTYKWLGTFGVAQEGSEFSISSASPSLQLTYTVVGTDGNGCSNSTEVNPLVFQLPTAKVVPSVAGSCPPLCTRFSIIQKPTNLTSIGWSFSNGNSFNDSLALNQCFNTPGIHNVQLALKDDKGCKGTATQTVEVYPNPKAEFEFDPLDPNENNNVVTFYDASTNAQVAGWNWDFESTGVDTARGNIATHTFPAIGNYFVKLFVRSTNGCVDSIIKKITVSEDMTMYVPNAFTPNGDGTNDTFNVFGVGIKKYNMEIFDRWGNLVFTANDISTGWDGKNRKGGDISAAGVYQYKITMSTTKDGKIKTFTGHVTLLK